MSRLSGISIYEIMTDLRDDFIDEAELDTRFVPMAAYNGRQNHGTRPSHRCGKSALARFLNSNWGVASVSLLIAFGVLIAILRVEPGIGSGGESGTIAEQPPVVENPTPTVSALLPGKVPFAAEPTNYTIFVDSLLYAIDTTLPFNITLTVTLTANTPGESVLFLNDWRLENLTDSDSSCSLSYTEEGYEQFTPAADQVATHSKSLYTKDLTPGIYRLHNMSGNRSVAYCEFAVDDEYGTYRTWVASDITQSAEGSYTISTAPTIPYGTSALEVTFTSVSPTTSLTVAPTLRLVKLDEPAAGAGACLPLYDWCQTVVADTDTPTSLSCSNTWDIINPAACTPGHYRLYAMSGNAYTAYCDFEITEGALGWPGASEADTSTASGTHEPTDSGTLAYEPADVRPFTVEVDTMSYGQNRLTVHYRATKPGVTLCNPSTQIALTRLNGETETAVENILISTDDEIVQVDPSDEHGGYAAFSKTHIIESPDMLLPGTYRLYALEQGRYIAYCDFEVLLATDD